MELYDRVTIAPISRVVISVFIDMLYDIMLCFPVL